MSLLIWELVRAIKKLIENKGVNIGNYANAALPRSAMYGIEEIANTYGKEAYNLIRANSHKRLIDKGSFCLQLNDI